MQENANSNNTIYLRVEFQRFSNCSNNQERPWQTQYAKNIDRETYIYLDIAKYRIQTFSIKRVKLLKFE